ncbi:MAG: response regulator [Candidatus Omnitrophica bacterium]|nr:response regulator [Candidatus Omnitrophota bacterium]
MHKLLVVDDDIEACDFLKRFFEKKDFQVFVANDGESAVSMVKKKRPDIILLDIKMPGQSGMKVLQEIKEIDKKSKVIMMTGVDEDTVVELAREYGATGYIIKPFSLEYLENDIMPKILEELI